jgi:hypothetical protein
LRLRTSAGRRQAGRGAIRNTGGETEMRQELAAAVGALVEHMDTTVYQLSDVEVDQLVKAADLVTLARSAVERDYRGEIEFAHDPEAPTRFAKQLVQLLRGAISIGMPPDEAMRLVRRCASDSIPPLRRDILLDLANNPGSKATDVASGFQSRETPSAAGSNAYTCSARWPARRPRKPAVTARSMSCGATAWRTGSTGTHYRT